MGNFFLFGDQSNCTLVNLEKIDSINFENVGSGRMYNIYIKYSSGASDDFEVMEDQLAKLSMHLDLAVRND